MAEAVILREVGLRDGLQLVRGGLSTERKIEWLREEAEAGVRDIEVTSFVPANSFPVFADAREVVAAALEVASLSASALAPNARGAMLAFDAGITKLNYVVSASAAHSQANVRRTSDDAMADFERIAALRNARGLAGSVTLSCGIATAFGCTIQGEVDETLVVELARRLVELGADEVMVADTVGYAHPGQVEQIFSEVQAEIPDTPISAHFHDTRGLGLANVAAAARVGIRRFDASLGGLGGCPHAPGATGNVNMEDAAFLLESLGFATGVDFGKILRLRHKLTQWLPEERLVGGIARSGLPRTFRSNDNFSG